MGPLVAAVFVSGWILALLLMCLFAGGGVMGFALALSYRQETLDNLEEFERSTHRLGFEKGYAQALLDVQRGRHLRVVGKEPRA